MIPRQLSLRTLRTVRWVQIAGLTFSVVDLARDLLRGYPGNAALTIALIVFWLLLLCVQTKLISLREALDRPRPDYDAIARMEREVYGETFKHEGAAGGGGGGSSSSTHRGQMCAKHDRPQRWDGRTTHPDTTEPATIGQYVAWLEGYVKRGGKPTHFYDYPFSRAGFRYASSRLVVDSDYEYGSSLRHIIVAKGVTTERTNPAGGFDGWAHTHLYFMHGYRTNDAYVPVYSDPEFDQFRTSGGAS